MPLYEKAVLTDQTEQLAKIVENLVDKGINEAEAASSGKVIKVNAGVDLVVNTSSFTRQIKNWEKRLQSISQKGSYKVTRLVDLDLDADIDITDFKNKNKLSEKFTEQINKAVGYDTKGKRWITDPIKISNPNIRDLGLDTRKEMREQLTYYGKLLQEREKLKTELSDKSSPISYQNVANFSSDDPNKVDQHIERYVGKIRKLKAVMSELENVANMIDTKYNSTVLKGKNAINTSPAYDSVKIGKQDFNDFLTQQTSEENITKLLDKVYNNSLKATKAAEKTYIKESMQNATLSLTSAEATTEALKKYGADAEAAQVKVHDLEQEVQRLKGELASMSTAEGNSELAQFQMSLEKAREEAKLSLAVYQQLENIIRSGQAGALVSSVSGNQNAQSKLNTAGGNVGSDNIEIPSITGENANTINTIIERLNKLESSIAEVRSEMNSLGDSVEFKQIGSEISNLQSQFQSLSGFIIENEGSQNLYQSELENTKVKLTELQSGLREVQNELQVLSSTDNLNGISEKFKNYSLSITEIREQLKALKTEMASGTLGSSLGATKDQTTSNVGNSEITSLTSLEEKVNSVKAAVEAKTQSFREEGMVVEGVVNSEISSLLALDNQLQVVIKRITELKQKMAGSTNSKSGQFGNVDNIEKLKAALQGFPSDSGQKLRDALQSLQFKKSVVNNVEKLAVALENLGTKLNGLGGSGQGFLSSINQLVSQGDALKNLVAIMRASEKQIAKAKNAAATNTSGLFDEAAYDKALKKYYQIQAKVVKGNATEVDNLEAAKYYDRIIKLEEQVRTLYKQGNMTLKERDAILASISSKRSAYDTDLTNQMLRADELQREADDKINRQNESAEKAKINQLLTEQSALYEKLFKSELELSHLDEQYNSTKAAQIREQMAGTQSSIELMDRELDAYGNKVNRLQQMTELSRRYEEMYNSYQLRDATSTDRSNNSINYYTSQLQSLERVSAQTDRYAEKIRELKTLITELSNIRSGNYTGTFPIEEANRFEQKIKQIIKELTAVNANRGTSAIGTGIKDSRQALEYLDQYVTKYKQYKKISATQNAVTGDAKMVYHLKDAEGQIKKVTFAYDKMSGTIRQTNESAISSISKVSQVISNLATKWKTIVGYKLMAYLDPYQFYFWGKEIVSSIVELDDALIDLQKTAQGTGAELNKFYYEANDVAKEYGTTTADVISQASSWSRLGYTLQDSKIMSQESSQFAAISPGMETEEATTGLVSIMQAFKQYGIEASNVETEVMDKINRVGNRFAVTNQDIVEGLQANSSAMVAANNSFDESVALFTAGNEIVQDASQVGTALKSISMRLRGYDEETEELSGDLVNINGVIADLTKTASKPSGISLFTDDTKETYKSTYEILKSVAEIWDELGDKQQAKLLEKMFAKTRANVGAAIIQNFSQAEKAMNEMENSAGSSDEEMENITQSLSYKINELKETWMGFAQEVVNRGDLGGLITGFTRVSEVVTGFIKQLGVIQTLVLSFGGVATLKNFGRTNIKSL